MTVFLAYVSFSFLFSCAGSPERPSPAEVSAGSSADSSAQEAGGLSADSSAGSPDNAVSVESDGIQAASPGRDQSEPAPAAFVFSPAEFSLVEAAPGVGLVTPEKRDKAASLDDKGKAALSESFRAAYVDSLFLGVPVAGVLGGDFVHSWPDSDPAAWAQNWRTSEPEDNSWGLPSLVLAVRKIETKQDAVPGRVYLVREKLLDYYGKSAGIDGANGTMGYGSPRGYEFFYEGKIAQRFDLGLITIDREGKGAFLPQSLPSSRLSPPPEVGVFPDEIYFDGKVFNGIYSNASRDDIRAAFLSAWKMALDRGIKTMVPDGIGQYLPFSDVPPDFPGGETLKGLYFQSFNQRSVLLVLPDSALLPLYPRLIAPPFMDVLFGPAESLPGGENLKPFDIKFAGADDLSRALEKVTALYGIPLTDPVPVKALAGAEEASPPASWRLGQRFSRGWITGAPAPLGD